MKIAFLLGSPDISGGSFVIFEHALYNKRIGNEVYILTEEKVSMDRLFWHPEAKSLIWKSIDEVSDTRFDYAIATWWRTFYEMYRVNAENYVYFVQSIETRFYGDDEPTIRKLVESSYILNTPIITEATWIKKYLEENYNSDVYLAHNGIRKDIFKTKGKEYPRTTEGLRVLIEGSVDVPFKNVKKAIELAGKSKAEEIWLLTISDIDEYEGVDKVFSNVPIYECAEIYRSCDVLVKLSYVEGMFGPPLEMFHCGGTAITYDVTGHDEYLVNEVNSLIVETDDEKGVVDAINRLHDDIALLKKLQSGGIRTAESWPDWNRSSERFNEALNLAMKNSDFKRSELESKSKFLFDFYVMAENKRLNAVKNSRFRKLLKSFEYNFPNVTRRLVKLKEKLGIGIRIT